VTAADGDVAPIELIRTFMTSMEARDWATLGSVLHADVVYELPQSRERIRGRDRYVRFNREFPGDWHLVPRVMLADDSDGSVLFDWRVGDEAAQGIVFFEFTGGLITKVTDFWPEPYEPPAGREHLTERW
jgi:ketosteroid isomerase-like protein